MSRLADLVLSHRLVVVVVWLLVAVAGAATATRTVDALSYDFGLPGQPAYEANVDIQRELGGGGLVDPVVLTVRAPAGTDLASGDGATAFAETARQVAASAPGTRVVLPGDGGASALVSPDGRRAVAILYPRVVPGPDPYAAALPAIERAAAASDVAGETPRVTGTALLAESAGGDRGILVEVVLGGAGALVVLAIVFGSLLAAVPLVVAAVSILGTYLALLGLTSVTDVSFVVQYLVALIGLGVAIDYSLLIVMRWREERSHGADNDTAVRTAVATAGRSVLFSGVTVAVSLAALVLVPLPFLRSIGLGGLLIPVLSVATALTLVPVVLHVAGPALQWPRRRPHDPTSRRWAALAGAVVRRRWLVIVGTVALLLAMTAPLLGLRLGSPEITAYGSSSEAGGAAQGIVDDGIAAGVIRPTEVLVDEADATRVATLLSVVPGVAGATAVSGEGWRPGSDALVQVWSEADPASPAGTRTLERVRTVADGQGARVGGTPAEDADFVTAVYGDAVWVLLGIVVVTFLLLARALRSLWLPVKALVLNVVSIGAAYGITVLIWQNGLGTEAVFGASASGAITVWVPVAVFAFLFGLSMDYEVFILSRMREAYDEHGDTRRAVVDGISRTGRLVTSAALILFLAFVALSTVPSIDVKILATALALGIAIDALVVRALLAPALVAVLGRANWTMPRGLARALRVHDAGSGSGRARHRASP
ncbi:MAG: MMPL family transporter [Nocardioidaceae bacterium]|nr:MMPL family transporter [Nocardioidaceae bacterium]